MRHRFVQFGFLSTILAGLALAPACGDAGSTFGGGASSPTGGTGAGDCVRNGQQCNFDCTNSLGCVECVTDLDCGNGQPICVAGHCEECGVSADCAVGESCYPENHECAPSCETNGDCQQDDAPLCDPTSGACVGCLSAQDCGGETPVCSPISGQCAECASASDCGAAQPHCELDVGRCRECLLDSHCGFGERCREDHCIADCQNDADCANNEGRPLCDVPSGQCVSCLTDLDCGVAAPICTPGGRCVLCQTDSDCMDPELPICKDSDECVQCTEDNHCDPGFQCKGQQCEPSN
ncbi:MAG: hypothetical protein KC731_07050 [Myxococcales bacterium]|nr:hypothetical protein [Myxococcales bacterium]